MRFIINLVVNRNQSWLHIPSWRRFGLRRLSCSLLSPLLGLWEHRWSQSECVLAFSRRNVQRWEPSVFLNKKSVQAGNVSGGKYQVDGSQDSALRLETENHSNLYIVVFVLPRWFVTASQWKSSGVRISKSSQNWIFNSAQSIQFS